MRDGSTGVLVPPADSAMLGAALARLVESSEVGRALGTAARDFVTPRFGADGYLASITTLYDRLLEEKRVA